MSGKRYPEEFKIAAVKNVAYIYLASGKSVPKRVIRTQSPQQLDRL
ncbi:TPA: hypothetical protein JZG68_002082 [Escherichia coli]|nr:hypothetical protein [Escherichia coli]